MIGILLTGHGEISSGLYSSLKMVFGTNENIRKIDFLPEDSSEILKEKISNEINELLNNNEAVLCLTDITGGTPFRTCSELSIANPKIRVISGTNLPMLITLASEMEDIDIEDAVNLALETGKDEISIFKLTQRIEIEEEDGI